MIKRTIICMAILLVLLSMAACQPSPEQQAAMTATAQTATAALWTATPTFTVTPSVTPTPTATPTETPTPTPTATFTPLPTETLVSGNRFVSADKTISFVLPEGWNEIPTGSKGTGFQVISANGTKATLLLYTTQYTLFGEAMDADDVGMGFFTAGFQDDLIPNLTDYQQISEDVSLPTNDGKSYFRWTAAHKVNGVPARSTFYIFGSGKWFLVAGYSRPENAGSEYDSIMDEAMKTMIFNHE